MKPFHYVEKLAMLEWKQVCSQPFKNEITYKLFTLKSYMYIHLNMCKQMTDANLLLLLRNTWNHSTVCKQMTNSKWNYSV